jgi:CRP-like cAMP-binding protein
MSADSIRRLEQGRALLSLPNAFHRVFVQINLLSSDAETGLTNLPKQRDIASAVNTSRETVSRALKLLIKNGVLNKAGNNIVIKQADTLKRLAIDGLEAIPME